MFPGLDWGPSVAAPPPASSASKLSQTGRAVLRPPNVRRTSSGSRAFAQRTGGGPAALDDVDRAMINHLLIDGKITNRGLAQRVGISESAASVRIPKLIDAGVLIFTTLIDWEAAGFEWFIVCRMKTRTRARRDVAKDISSLFGCEAVAVVLGFHDILGYFLAVDRAELNGIIDALHAVNGIAVLDVELATETSVSTRGRQLFLAVDAPPIRLPAPRVGLDELDIELLQALVEDGRQSSRSVARAFGVSEGTIRARTSRLYRSGLAQVVAMVEPVALEIAGVIASLSIRIDRRFLDSAFATLLNMPNVVFGARCIGAFDLHLTVTSPDPHELIEFVGSRVQSVPGVLDTDTLLFVDVLRFSPYLKRLAVPLENTQYP
ncbi:Lrp/AsnC family transcriptional regulator [Mycobacteroides abscessus]|uniref:Lrp/AsnC family transcriptional regulator n=1 Tax=Mycobacteroides abscessus TaxID=36809 RepID=UPI000DD57BF7|nr:AsnC family transcriptional regulator [Mycobacteroides abscessus]